MAENNLEVMKDEMKKETTAIVARATRFEINDATSNQKATGVLSEIARRKKKTVDARMFMTRPIDESKKNIMNFFKPFIEQYDKATAIIKGKAKDYYLAEEEKAKEAEKKRLIAEIKREEEIRKAQEENREPVIDEIPAIPEVKAPEKTVRGVAGGSMTFKKHWKHEVINPELVPKEYFIIDESLIREAIRNGAREISGVRIYEDVDASVRR